MERDYFEELGVDGLIISKCVFTKFVVEAWTELAEDRDRYRALLTVVIMFRVT
jgi:hypothetical protein